MMTAAFLLALFSLVIVAELAWHHSKRADFWHKAFLGQHESHMAFLRELQAQADERIAAVDRWRERHNDGLSGAIRRDWN